MKTSSLIILIINTNALLYMNPKTASELV